MGGWATKMACISSSAWQQQAVVVLFLIAVAASQCGAVRHMGTAPSVVKLSEHNLPGTTQVENSRAVGHALANAKNTVQLTAAADDRYHDIGIVVVFEVAPLITQFTSSLSAPILSWNVPAASLRASSLISSLSLLVP